jgi:hypothetical protein
MIDLRGVIRLLADWIVHAIIMTAPGEKSGHSAECPHRYSSRLHVNPPSLMMRKQCR